MSKKKAGSGKKDQQDQTITGVTWYRRDQWPLLLQTAADRAALEDTYEEWLGSVQKAIADLSSQGIQVLKVPVDLGDLFEWCEREGRRNDGAARAAYTSKKLYEMNQEK